MMLFILLWGIFLIALAIELRYLAEDHDSTDGREYGNSFDEDAALETFILEMLTSWFVTSPIVGTIMFAWTRRGEVKKFGDQWPDGVDGTSQAVSDRMGSGAELFSAAAVPVGI